MGDVEAGGEQPGFSLSYVSSPPGILKIIEAILLFITIACGFACCTGFFLYMSIVSLIVVIIFFCLFAFNVVDRFPNNNWKKTVFVDSIVFAVCMLIAMILLANAAQRAAVILAESGYTLAASVYVTLFAGFASVIAFVVDAIIHYQIMTAPTN